MFAVGFLTFGFQQTLCGIPPLRFKYSQPSAFYVNIHGVAYEFSKEYKHPGGISIEKGIGRDVSSLFPFREGSACRAFTTTSPGGCVVEGVWPQAGL